MARIMIVDDEQPVREALSALIEAAGHVTRTVADGGRCLEILETFQPNLVITDILMPNMEGLETIRELRKRRPDLPIIAISGAERFGGMNYLALTERLGASQSIPKPVSPRALIAALADLLGNPGARGPKNFCDGE